MAYLRQYFIDDSGQQRIRLNAEPISDPNFIQLVEGRLNVTDTSDSTNMYVGGYGGGINYGAITSTQARITFQNYTSASIGILVESLMVSDTIADANPPSGVMRLTDGSNTLTFGGYGSTGDSRYISSSNSILRVSDNAGSPNVGMIIYGLACSTTYTAIVPQAGRLYVENGIDFGGTAGMTAYGGLKALDINNGYIEVGDGALTMIFGGHNGDAEAGLISTETDYITLVDWSAGTTTKGLRVGSLHIGANVSGTVTNGNLGLQDGGNIEVGTSTGTQIATATSQKLGFYGVTPVVQPTALTSQLTTITFTDPSTPDYAIQDLTQSSPYGFVTADEAQTVLSVIANLQTRVSELESRLQALGLLA